MENVTQNLFDFLVDHYQLSEDQLEQAAELAGAEDLNLERALVRMELIPPEGVSIALADNANMKPLNLAITRGSPELFAELPLATMLQHKILPISRIGKTLTVAMDDPFDVIALETVSAQSGYKLMTVVVSSSSLDEMLESRLSGQQDGQDRLEETLSSFSEDEEISQVSSGDNYDLEDYGDEANEKPVIRIVNSILVEAMRKGASDIHIEPGLDDCQVRYRVYGVLISAGSPPKGLFGAIVSRIKIMSELDIAERRIPQDGRCRIRALDKEVDIRVSILPVIHGEKIVMRILDKSNLPKGLGDLGLDEYSEKTFARALAQPYGMIFVTGPTGSGKTTTLYSALQELNEPTTNIVTVEDPVEYQLQGINQVQTHSEVGLTFAAGLRSILRQDPAIVLVGEVRDFETASIAVQAALTGHLVLSTLHTNDTPGAVARLKNMGIEPFMLASALILAQAQRLYRRLCPACKKTLEVTMDVLRNVAVKQGMITLQRAGLNKVFEGLTSIDEVLRITSSA